MAPGTVQISGLREVTSALRKIDRSLPKLVTDDLKKAADPVVDEAKRKIGRYRGASLGTIKPRVTGRAVFVQQKARKRGPVRRGNFGALQQRRLDEALEEKAPEVLREVEQALDRIVDGAGF